MLKLFKPYYSHIVSLILSRTAKNTIIVFAGNAIAAVISLGSIMIISRTLGPNDFGLFSIAMAVMTTIVGFTNLGLSQGLVRFFNLYSGNKRRRGQIFLNLGFKIQLIISAFILIFGLIFSESLARFLSDSNSVQLVMPLRLAVIGSVGMSLGVFITTVLQAHERFIRFGFYPVFMNGLRLVLISTLLILSILTLNNSFWVYGLVPLITFFVGFFIIKKDFLFVKPLSVEKTSVLFELFHFSKWIALSYFLTSISGRLDILMLSKLKGGEDVGFYSAAFNLIMIFPLIIGAISSVLIPKVSQMVTKEELQVYIKKSVPLATVLTLTIVPIFLLTPIIINLIFGERYLNSIPIFKILLITYGLNLILLPFSLIFISLNKTKISSFASIVQIIAIFVAQLLLVPQFGGIGAAWARVLASFSSFLLHFIFLAYYLRRLQPGKPLLEQLKSK